MNKKVQWTVFVDINLKKAVDELLKKPSIKFSQFMQSVINRFVHLADRDKLKIIKQAIPEEYSAKGKAYTVTISGHVLSSFTDYMAGTNLQQKVILEKIMIDFLSKSQAKQEAILFATP